MHSKRGKFLSIVMALALFYFSIKLFFFSPPREEQHPLPSTVNPPAVTEPYEGGDDYGDELPPIDDMDDEWEKELDARNKAKAGIDEDAE